MIVYPAIDLLDGTCVRLRQGDFDRVTRFSADPVHVAREFAAGGAEALHVVDLGGAKQGRPEHQDLIGRILDAFGGPVQVGGGIRTKEQATSYLESGVHRLLLGTAAVSGSEWPGDLVERYGPDRIAAAVDVRDGKVLQEGWLTESGGDMESVSSLLRSRGIDTVLYTDTRRDGTLTSVDRLGTRALVQSGFRVIAAGGVSSTEDIRALKDIGAFGAVIGSALYHGRLSLRDALEASC
ncbi:MAG: 1-(5-phosphoribosyl)-5-[(5-phosphoribosylamino)methylideneamino] imidazole-4-carboxamide isomerase [marine benthic group bacterium]|jgi:phosphoribosylformimino-5-aminoimidazole carboxamide ribotide isomerase|nr:1-(5-phosphoribosyl)-5-[(5-phosphoribosylamino)methylideneamino] imidazole-4-carboxamide isomerase [Gemmatimonadota bacterium]MCL7965312.1 1-(5-phosphoribosyl)-5-[(5-phosphoribosylamino)methylideneamino] imidazole-4-carboxamide isomerase [Gemmatimonadota bacterium]MCL7966062.1 1-(5-phosphoribosyl)-5-[(5-phosphoribosylamino)methylideneamino] imidazole-4-carboxamide isomerase [Gemmatimonadota bacterium]MCL7968319.1 1-(5-phosphoribosyl)-5-[(5-phosphoribosylamino)methylideneamino] imidazole-4-car